MSDLYCAATLVVARHAEAEYESELACGCGRLLDAGWTGPGSRAGGVAAPPQGRGDLVQRRCRVRCRQQRSRRPSWACPCGSGQVFASSAVGDLAGQPFTLDLFADVFAAWRAGDLSVGCPGAETGRDVVRRGCTAELESVADEYRGETVLVVSHGGVIQLVLPRLATNVSTDCGFSRTDRQRAAPAKSRRTPTVGCCDLERQAASKISPAEPRSAQAATGRRRFLLFLAAFATFCFLTGLPLGSTSRRFLTV